MLEAFSWRLALVTQRTTTDAGDKGNTLKQVNNAKWIGNHENHFFYAASL